MPVRVAVPADNAALLALAAQCPMAGDLTFCIERDPQFFALNRLEGDFWRVGVATAPDGRLTGCAAMALRRVYLDGREQTAAYASDFKVHPQHRGRGAAHALLRWGRDLCRELGGEDLPLLSTVLAGNRAMEQLTSGRGPLRAWTRFATIQAHAIPLFAPRRLADAGLRIRSATTNDLEAMLALWQLTAPRREFSPVFDRPRFTAWLAQAGGLALDDYLLAWQADGQLAGFIGVWEQHAIKRLRLYGYSRRIARLRVGLNAVAGLTGGPRLPAPGAILPSGTIVHHCIRDAAPLVLHALLRRAYRRLRARGCTFFTLGLDVRDPLSAAVRGLFSQPAVVHAYLATPAGPWGAPPPVSRPMYYEVGLT